MILNSRVNSLFFILSLTAIFLIIVSCATNKDECDGDNNGCNKGFYCAHDNTCEQDCVNSEECSDGLVCNDHGQCVLWAN